MYTKEIKEWYLKSYPNDVLGTELNDNVTFYDLFIALDTYQDVYKTLNVSDSILRERIFKKLADIMRVDYGYIYDQWLKGQF